MSRWQKLHERDSEGRPYVRVTNGYGKSFRCENDWDAEWLLKLLRQHGDAR